jgi:hypothetical protein
MKNPECKYTSATVTTARTRAALAFVISKVDCNVMLITTSSAKLSDGRICGVARSGCMLGFPHFRGAMAVEPSHQNKGDINYSVSFSPHCNIEK